MEAVPGLPWIPSSSVWTRWQPSVPTPCEKTKVVPRRTPESLSLIPISWDLVVSIYRELLRLIQRLPFRKKLIVCIVFKGNKFRFDLGEVKAAGLVCLIGLGVSLGTLLLYRLYFRIIVPFLHNVWSSKGKNSVLDDEYTLYLESDSEVDSKMGNSQSKKSTPFVYYAPGCGVTLGSRPSFIDMDSCSSQPDKEVRLRGRKPNQPRTKSPSPASDKDSAIGVGDMSQSFYSDNSANRDSFYSTCTAESGFDDYGFLDDLKNSKLSGSLKENFSPNSLIERNLHMLYRAHHGNDAGLNSIGRSVKPGLETLSDCSSERSGIVSSRSYRSSCDGQSLSNTSIRTNIDPLVQKLTSERSVGSTLNNNNCCTENQVRIDLPHQDSGDSSHCCAHAAYPGAQGTYPDAQHTRSCSKLSKESSPRHRVSPYRDLGLSPRHASKQSHNKHRDWTYEDDPNMDYDPSLDVSESIRSFTSSAEDIDWDCDDDARHRVPSVPHFQQSLSDVQFKQSLMQRIHEWSNFAEEYHRSRSPTPDCYPVKFVRRSRSLDRHLGDPSLVLVSDPAESKAIEIEPTVERNLETLEYELHDIQGEFESITSKLHELIEQGSENSSHQPAERLSKNQGSALGRGHRAVSAPRTIETKQLTKMRTQWDHVPSSACSDSSRSSRASSVEYAWDLGDYKHQQANHGCERPNSCSHSEGMDLLHVASRGLCSQDSQPPEGSVTINIGLPLYILNYAEQEWKGGTEKARTIKEGYNQVPRLWGCHRISLIRGDNYCGLRSVLYQVLINGLRVHHRWSGVIRIMDNLHDLYHDPSSGLSDWTFANRLSSHCRDQFSTLSKCALTLYATIEEVCNLASQDEREHRSLGLFNTSAIFDVELMEGLKIMMLQALVALRKEMESGGEVPLFVQLLFARETSQSVSAFLKNHLNCVGDTAGLEQVEMCLLAYTLGVKVRILRLAHYGQEDFECVFPDDAPFDWPEIGLLVEDDRHYNVPLP